MRALRLASAGVIASFALVMVGQQAAAQSPQYYGYPDKQAPAPSGQAGYSCQPSPGCYVEKWGCHVAVCPPPACQNACYQIASQIPGLETPSCQNACVIVNEGPPPPPTTITIFRNHYVPIRVETKPTLVQPVNIEVRWREIHYLCDCPPGTTQCPHIPTGTPQAKAPAAPATQTVDAATPKAPVVFAAQAPARDVTPSKRWVWLEKQQLFGFGYQRPDGLWVIDPNSKRPTPPDEQASADARPTAANVTAADMTGA